MDLTPQQIGERIKTLRKERRWTLQELGKRAGVSISALSKVENAQVAASFDTLLKIARGFGLGFEAMLNGASPLLPAGRLTTTRDGTGVFFSTDMYEYQVHSAELRQKHMIPLHMEVKARELADITRWSSHEGEEFIYVLQGHIELHTELYAPMLLKAGDSAYIDSKMPHAFLNRGKGRAWMLSICFSRDIKFPGEGKPPKKKPADRKRSNPAGSRRNGR
jgi:transcriptional regulator with XRE-family HTH domain